MLELLIVGAGPAGLAAAIRARQRGLGVRVLSKGRGARVRLGESLSPAATPVLQELGCWPDFVADRHLPCPGNSWAWSSDALEFHSFTMDPRGGAWHIDRERFESRLRERALALGAELVEIRSTPTVEARAGGFCVSCGLGSSVDVGFVLDASGRGAALARALGATRIVEDQQVALVCQLRSRGPASRDRTSMVEAVPEGWWYSSLLPDGGLALLLFTTRARGVELAGNTDELWSLLQASVHTRARVDPCEPCGPARLVAANSEHLDLVAGERWRAVGDAALTYDPLASHGISFALVSGRDAVDSIAAALTGDGAQARASYVETVEGARRTYAAARRRIYAAQGRWRDQPYWRSRG